MFEYNEANWGDFEEDMDYEVLEVPKLPEFHDVPELTDAEEVELRKQFDTSIPTRGYINPRNNYKLGGNLGNTFSPMMTNKVRDDSLKPTTWTRNKTILQSSSVIAKKNRYNSRFKVDGKSYEKVDKKVDKINMLSKPISWADVVKCQR